MRAKSNLILANKHQRVAFEGQLQSSELSTQLDKTLLLLF